MRARERRVNRYYDPATEQWLSVDPDVAETGQPYAFTGDDPLNATDPLGNIATNQFGAGCGAVASDCGETTTQENSSEGCTPQDDPSQIPYCKGPGNSLSVDPSSGGTILEGLGKLALGTAVAAGVSEVVEPLVDLFGTTESSLGESAAETTKALSSALATACDDAPNVCDKIAGSLLLFGSAGVIRIIAIHEEEVSADPSVRNNWHTVAQLAGILDPLSEGIHLGS
jgi:hypothetical protein